MMDNLAWTPWGSIPSVFCLNPNSRKCEDTDLDDEDNHFSLLSLLDKAHTINSINENTLKDIKSRTDQEVITHNQYTLKPKKLNGKIGMEDELFAIVNKTRTRKINDIITAWKYSGEPLRKERIAIGNFIDINLENFEDLNRLQRDYGLLLDQYSRILRDETESRDAVEGVLSNMEKLRLAIEDLYEETLSVEDDVDNNDEIRECLKILSRDMKKLQKKFPGLYLSLNGIAYERKQHIPESTTLTTPHNLSELYSNLNGIDEETKLESIPKFDDCSTLTCKHTLSEHNGVIFALQPYLLNDKQYLASASGDKTIKLWDLSNNCVVATLKGHTETVRSLALYTHGGEKMLVSGSRDNTIKLWKLSNNSNTQTLTGHSGNISSLTIFEKERDIFLVSGSADMSIKIWNLDNLDLIASIKAHQNVVYALSTYYLDGKPYLVSGGHDCKIKIWNLDDKSLVRSLVENISEIYSLVVVDCDYEKILASGDSKGQIKLWNLKNYECLGTIKARSGVVWSLEVHHCQSKVCLICPGNGKSIMVWDMMNRTVMATLSNDTIINKLRVFMIGDQGCLATGDSNGNIKLWME